MSMDHDWREFTIDELLALSNGINADKSAYGRGLPFINVLEVITHESMTTSDIPGRVRLPRTTLDRYRVKRGDVLFNRTSETQDEVGLTSVYIGDDPVVFGGFVFRGRPKTADLDIDFSKYAFRAPSVRQQITARGQGGIRANIGQRDLKSVRVSLPGLAEQRAIAHAIEDASALVATLERQIAKKQAIKQGLMQQLLTGRARLPGFTDAWRATTLGKLGAFLKGRGVKRDDVRPAGVACIRYGELYTEFQNYTATARSFVNPDVAATALPIRSGDLLFAGSGETRGEIGMCVAYVGGVPAVAGGDIVVLRGSGFNAIYLATLTNLPFVASQKARAGQGDAVVHISSRALGEIEVAIPSVAEQDAIAEVIVDADREVDALRLRLGKARAIKLGMLQQLLTGQSRLPVEVAP